MDMEKTGTYLASLRRGRDMTQQQVADILGVSNKTVSKWESGAVLITVTLCRCINDKIDLMTKN